MSFEGQPGQGLTALVVDDELVLREALDDLLGEAGFEVTLCESLADARGQLEKRLFDLALLDKNLPDGTGLELAAEIHGSGVDTRIIMITGYGNLESAIEAMRCGISDYVTKPFELPELTTRVTNAVAMLRLERENHRLSEDLKQKNRILEDLATRDPLTRLFNHAYLQENLEKEVLRSQRTGQDVSLVFIDVDNFKEINDDYGHPTGDLVLRFLSDLLQGRTRVTDLRFRLREHDVPARYGGDEFALLLPETSKVGAATLAERIRSAIDSLDFASQGLPPITLSIGIASYPRDASNRNELLEMSDAALRVAKKGGRNQVVSFSEEMRRDALGPVAAAEHELAMLAAVDTSVSERSFDFVYQPIVHLGDTAAFAYEALVRPRHELFPGPLELIHTAERSGRIHNLGRVLREMALEPIDQLDDGVLLFINLHPFDLYDQQLLAVEEFARAHVKRVVFEVTEVTMIRDYSRARASLAALQKAGFRIAIDDFGAGYSGINNLALLEPDFVKLDMSLVREVEGESRRARLIRHLVEFCEGEGIHVVAEGVETADEVGVVRELGCRFAQGYFFARPAPAFVEARSA